MTKRNNAFKASIYYESDKNFLMYGISHPFIVRVH